MGPHPHRFTYCNLYITENYRMVTERAGIITLSNMAVFVVLFTKNLSTVISTGAE